MGFRNWIRRRSQEDRALTGGGLSYLFGGTTLGRAVTERSAMQLTAVYSCVRVLAEAIAGLPLHVYRTAPDGGRENGRSSVQPADA